GIAASVGMIRVLNAIPVLCILLYGGWRKPRQLGIALGAAAAFMAPLLFISYLWDHTFITDYVAGITAYPFNGTPKASTQLLGPDPGLILTFVGFIDYGLLLLAYPLLRIPPEQSSPSTVDRAGGYQEPLRQAG